MLTQKKYLPENISKSIDSFLEEHGYSRPITEISSINELFNNLNRGIATGSLNETLIGYHIFNHLTKKDVRKRKRAAYSFEEIISELLGGIRAEDIPTSQRPRLRSQFNDSELKRRVERNILEKGDVLIDNQYFSVKTLVPSNLEINAGSFSIEALFKDFISPIPQQRGELGSKPLLTEKFRRISGQNRWPDIASRFKQMAEEIYHCHWIIGIKADRHLTVYTMNSNRFRSLLKSYFDDDWRKPVDFVNRFEGNALRIATAPFFESANRIDINLIGPGTKIIERVDGCCYSINSVLLDLIRKGSQTDQIMTALTSLIEDEVKEITKLLEKT